MKNLRHLAFKVLTKVERGSFLQPELRRVRDLSDRDYSFLSYLTKGVMQEKLKLRSIVAEYSNRPVEKIDEAVLLFLYIGLYQLLFMDGVPPHAAVHETVEAVKVERLHSSTGYVNGLLRSVLRKPPRQREDGDYLENLAYQYSWPKWLVDRWANQMSQEALNRLLRFFHEKPQTSLFVNTLMIERDELRENLEKSGFAVRSSEFFEDMLVVESGGRLTETEFFRKGCFYIQDEASRLVAKIVSFLSPEGKILDAAAAPGGKSINLIVDGFSPVSCDVSFFRVGEMSSNLQRMGLTGYTVVLDGGAPLPFKGTFPVVLLDAPCTATGKVRRAPEIKYRLKPDSFAKLAYQQKALFDSLAEAVSLNGYLVYSTCSIDRVENEDLVNAFLIQHQEFHLVKSLGEPGNEIEHFLTAEGFFRTQPTEHNVDGFFIAVLKKS